MNKYVIFLCWIFWYKMEFLMNMKFYKVPLITIVIIWQETLKIYSKSIPIVEHWNKQTNKKKTCTFILKAKERKIKVKFTFTLPDTNKNTQICIQMVEILMGNTFEWYWSTHDFNYYLLRDSSSSICIHLTPHFWATFQFRVPWGYLHFLT